MKRLLNVLFVALLACLLCTPANAAATQKEWTFMVFLNADNNLDTFGYEDLQEMVAAGGSSDFCNIVVLIDREHGPANTYYVTKDGEQLIKEMGEVDMGDYKELVKFVTSTAKAYPAKHYSVVVWNHGSGWKDGHGEILKGISYDDSSNNHITTNQLTTALNQITKALGKKIDVFGFDACLMQMVEVVYAMKDGCDYVVASEETEPGHGWPYTEIVSNLKKGMTAEAFAKNISKQYAASYDGGSAGSSSTTQSVVKTAELPNLVDAINGYAKAAMSGKYAAEFKDALAKVQKFYYRTNIDLGHFVALTKKSITDASFQTAVTKLEAAYKKTVLQSNLSGYSTKYATGLAIYFPTSSSSFSSDYNELAFAKDCFWEAMVKDYYKKVTARRIISEVISGNVSGLAQYVSEANENNREISEDLVSKLNFRVFVEGGVDASTQKNVSTLINELKNK